MQLATRDVDTVRYARCVEASKRIRWEIEKDVIRGRFLDTEQKFLPDGLSMVDRLTFLTQDEQRFLSQIQGRTYANMFGMVERFICAKVLEMSRDHWFGDQTALEALIRFCDEEVKHQAMFRRVEALAAEAMPPGYQFLADPDEVATAVMSKGTWAVLALTLHIELFTQQHYRESIAPDPSLSVLFKEVFLYHWKEESQHATLDELEWTRFDASITDVERDRGVNEFIELIGMVDGIIEAQAAEDVRFFTETVGRALTDEQHRELVAGVRAAYRWQYILSGARHPQFLQVLRRLITTPQAERINAVLTQLM